MITRLFIENTPFLLFIHSTVYFKKTKEIPFKNNKKERLYTF